jgi:hypothetical protein
MISGLRLQAKHRLAGLPQAEEFAGLLQIAVGCVKY